MSLTALGLLLIAAICHAAWNLLLKTAGEKHIATWLALLVASAGALPLLLTDLQSNEPSLSLRVWPYALSSAVCEAAYYATLATAYRDGDFSLVYPLARGTAPALLMVWSLAWLGETPRLGGLLGIAVVLLGLMVLGGSNVWQKRQGAQHRTHGPLSGERLSLSRSLNSGSIGLSLLVALFISLYSAIDGAAVKHFHPVPYTALIFVLTTILLTPFMLTKYPAALLLAHARRHWLPISSVGILSPVAYGLVLNAYAISPVSYAGAVREVSIVFGALAGWLWLGEEFGAIRTAGALLVFSGIFVIAIFG